jgi:H+-transporting ATPase
MVLFGIVQTPGIRQLFGCTPLGPIGWMQAMTSAGIATVGGGGGGQAAAAARGMTRVGPKRAVWKATGGLG